jgi:hypothetical protein
MKLEPPLANLIKRCQTVCVAECCGIDAYDFSPIHIASSLIMWRGKPDASEIQKLRGQIEVLRENYGSTGASDHGVIISEMNQSFTPEQVDAMANELLVNLAVALNIIEVSEKSRYGDSCV